MATNIPPHNLGELVDVLSVIIQNPEATVSNIPFGSLYFNIPLYYIYNYLILPNTYPFLMPCICVKMSKRSADNLFPPININKSYMKQGRTTA